MRPDFQRFCVVGLGNHAKTKLIPALVENGQQIAGVVSSQDGQTLPWAPVFSTLEQAIAALPADTVFVIASAPFQHFRQASLALKAGHDVILEKPAVLTRREAEDLADLAHRNEAVLVEAFMYRHGRLYHRFLCHWRRERAHIEALKISFLIPEMPSGTFRQAADLGSSGLYDVGCYPLSLLADLDLPMSGLDVSAVACPGQPAKEALRLTGVLAGVAVEVDIGVGEAYANSVQTRSKDGDLTTFSPFFYGRAGDRSIATASGVEILPDGNAFQTMFAVERPEWTNNQAHRMAKMAEVTSALEILGRTLLAHRAEASNN